MLTHSHPAEHHDTREEGLNTTIFTELSRVARHRSPRALATIAMISAAVALAAVLIGRGSWILLAACYCAWSFAGWGLLFRRDQPRAAWARVLELLIVGSASLAVIAVAFGLYGIAIGGQWMP